VRVRVRVRVRQCVCVCPECACLMSAGLVLLSPACHVQAVTGLGPGGVRGYMVFWMHQTAQIDTADPDILPVEYIELVHGTNNQARSCPQCQHASKGMHACGVSASTAQALHEGLMSYALFAACSISKQQKVLVTNFTCRRVLHTAVLAARHLQTVGVSTLCMLWCAWTGLLCRCPWVL